MCFIPVAQALIILGSDIRATPCAAQRSTTLHLSQLSSISSISSICSMLSACRNLARLWYPVTQYCTKSLKCTWQSAISMSPAGQVQSLNSQQVKLSSLALTDVCWNALHHASAKSSSHMFTAQINLYSASAWVAVTQVVLQKLLLQIASFCMEQDCKEILKLLQAKVRSRAMTAQAPASSAIFACSLFITSMMTSQSGATSVRIVLFTSCSRKVCPQDAPSVRFTALHH